MLLSPEPGCGTMAAVIRRAQPGSRAAQDSRPAGMPPNCLRFAVALCLALWLGNSAPAQTAAPSSAAEDYSGMYTFLQDGEFVQISLEDGGAVTGFISRYGDGDSDRGEFLDQFFKTGSLDGRKLSFVTRTVHGVWYQFTGTVGRGEGKTLNEEGYYILKGTLIQNTSDVNKKTTAKVHAVVFKSFPRDVESGPESSPPPAK